MIMPLNNQYGIVNTAQLSKTESQYDSGKLEVFFTPEAKQKILELTALCDSECGGLLVINDINNKILIEDIIIPEQKVTSFEVDFNGNMLAKMINDIAINSPELLPKIKGWWHSHCNYNTFWSATDDATIHSLTEAMSYVVSVNSNKENNILVRVDVMKPIRITINNIPFSIELNSSHIKDWCKQQLTRIKVRNPQYRITKTDMNSIPSSVYMCRTLEEYKQEYANLWSKLTKKVKKKISRYYKELNKVVEYSKWDNYERNEQYYSGYA